MAESEPTGPITGIEPVTQADIETILRARFGAVRTVTTPLNAVFLTDRDAFKMKLPVKFPFVDFTRPTDRRAAALREIARNRSAAPQIYQDVVVVTRTADGALELNGDGSPVEWLVHMHRFDDTMTLDHVVEREGLSPELIAQLACSVATQHYKAPVRDALPWIRDLETYLDQNRAAFRSYPDVFPSDRAAAFDQATRQSLGRLEALLEERGRMGAVRLLHGDLHLRNIVLIDDQPVLFDALEFDDAVATGDQLYDLAFLLMDLLARGARAAAFHVLRLYLLNTSILDLRTPVIGRRAPLAGQFLPGLAALPFFIAMRASIRAKVAAAAAFTQPDEAERRRLNAEALRYFALAERQIEPVKPVLIAIGGLSGTGKSKLAMAVGARLGCDPGAIIAQSVALRKFIHGRAPSERLPLAAYSEDATRRTYAKVMDVASLVLPTGYTVIVDAVFARPEERAACEAVAKAAEIPFIGLWLDAPLDIRRARVGARVNDVSDADVEVATRQETYALGDLTWTRIDASGTFEETRDRVLVQLAEAGLALADVG